MIAWCLGFEIEDEHIIISSFLEHVDILPQILKHVAAVWLVGLNENFRSWEEHVLEEEPDPDDLIDVRRCDEASPGTGEGTLGVLVLVEVAPSHIARVARRIDGAAGLLDPALCEELFCVTAAEDDDGSEQRADQEPALTADHALYIVFVVRRGHITFALHGALLLLWCATAQAEEEVSSTPTPRVFRVVLPLNSPGYGQLEAQITEAALGAAVELVTADDEEFGLSPDIIQQLAQLEEEAVQHELELQLGEAAMRRRRAVELLEQNGATATQPGRLAEALARLAATEIQAENRNEAVRLWRRALALRTDLSLDSTFTPTVREAFEEARRQGGTLPPRPDRSSLDQICEERGVDAVLWIAVGYDEGDLTLVRVFHRPEAADQAETRHVLQRPDPGADLTLPQPIVTGIEETLASLNPRPEGNGTDGRERCSPYYRCWWFYFTIGVVVVGAALTAGLVVGLGEDQVDMIVHMP